MGEYGNPNDFDSILKTSQTFSFGKESNTVLMHMVVLRFLISPQMMTLEKMCQFLMR